MESGHSPGILTARLMRRGLAFPYSALTQPCLCNKAKQSDLKPQMCTVSQAGGQKSKIKVSKGWFFQKLRGDSVPGPSSTSGGGLAILDVPCLVDTSPRSQFPIHTASFTCVSLSRFLPFTRTSVTLDMGHPTSV